MKWHAVQADIKIGLQACLANLLSTVENKSPFENFILGPFGYVLKKSLAASDCWPLRGTASAVFIFVKASSNPVLRK